jgi:hypothetical protein
LRIFSSEPENIAQEEADASKSDFFYSHRPILAMVGKSMTLKADMIPFSVLDLSPIAEGATAADALHRSRDLARHAEGWGYRRYWLAEHHNMAGIASATMAVVIDYVAEGTKTIRIDLGLGRAPEFLFQRSPESFRSGIITAQAMHAAARRGGR